MKCLMCYFTWNPSDVITLESCGHTFCINCLKKVLNIKKRFYFHCLYFDGENICSQLFTSREVRAIITKLLVNVPKQVEDETASIASNETLKNYYGTIPKQSIRSANDPRCSTTDPPLLECTLCFGKFLLHTRPHIRLICRHTFCEPCLTQAIVTSPKPFIRCPYHDKFGYRCRHIIENAVIESLTAKYTYKNAIDWNLDKYTVGPIPMQLTHSGNDSRKCPLCFVECLTQSRAHIQLTCGHSFCEPCLTQAIETSSNPFIRCPYHDKFGYRCRHIIENAIIQILTANNSYTNYKTHNGMYVQNVPEMNQNHAIDWNRDKYTVGSFPMQLTHSGNDLRNSKSNPYFFECPLCFGKFLTQSRAHIQLTCGHSFCEPCLTQVIETGSNPFIKCPHYDKFGYRCRHIIEYAVIHNLTAKNTYENYATRNGMYVQNVPEMNQNYAIDWNRDKYSSINKNFDRFSYMGDQEQNNYNTSPKVKNKTGRRRPKKNGTQKKHTDTIPEQLIRSENDPRNSKPNSKKLSPKSPKFFSNSEPFICSVCFVPHKAREGVRLQNCLHDFCRDCLIEWIEQNEAVEIECPENNCNEFLSDKEIRGLLTPEAYNKFLEKSLRLAEKFIENTVHCKTPDCPFWGFYVEGDEVFVCDVCRKKNCIPCEAIHEGLTCKDYNIKLQNDKDANLTNQQLKEMLAANTAMKCPNCQMILVKVTGCDWLVCTMCRTELCWATKGARWGPKGRGDTSGGCRCRKNAKCHPLCKSCH